MRWRLLKPWQSFRITLYVPACPCCHPRGVHMPNFELAGIWVITPVILLHWTLGLWWLMYEHTKALKTYHMVFPVYIKYMKNKTTEDSQIWVFIILLWYFSACQISGVFFDPLLIFSVFRAVCAQWCTGRGAFWGGQPPSRNSEGLAKSCQTKPDCENC